MTRNQLFSTLIATALLATPALAQTEKFLKYDMSQTVQMKGAVQGLDWMNPNSILHVAIKNTKTGKSEDWQFVMGPPKRSEEAGWTKDSVKRGEQVTIEAYPSSDGSKSAQLVSVKLPNGKMLMASGPNPIVPGSTSATPKKKG